MATQNGTIIRRVVANKADLKSGPLVLADGQLGLATTEDVIVFRDLAGNFHEFQSSVYNWVKNPVATFNDLGTPTDGAITYVTDIKSLFIRTATGWEEVSNNDVVKKAGDTMTGALDFHAGANDGFIELKLAGTNSTPQINIYNDATTASNRMTIDVNDTSSRLEVTYGGTDYASISADSNGPKFALVEGASTLNIEATQIDATGRVLTFPTDAGGTIATREWTAPQLELKQTVFNGVCQIQYLTENDVSIDCTGTLPRYSINTVRNGTVISASNPLCFYTDGNGVSEKWTSDVPIHVDFAYTTGIWYFHISTLGVLTATQTPWTEFGTICVLHRMYLDSTLSGNARNVTEIVEYHKNDISAADHLWKHQVNGTVYITGLDITSNILPINGSGVPTSSPNADGRNTCISISSGSTLDENLQVNILNSTTPVRFSQDLGNVSAGALTSSNSALFKISYNDAGGILKMLSATRFPFSFNASTNIPEYITTAGVRTSISDNTWMVNYVYSFGDPRFGEAVKVRSATTQFASHTNAVADSWENLQAVFPTLRDKEIRPLYKLIHYVNSSGGAYDVAVKFAGLIGITDIRKLTTSASTATSGTTLASSVVVVPAGNIASTNAQSALEELDAEKLAIAGVDQTVTNSGFMNFVRSTTGTILELFHGAVSKFLVTDTAITASVPLTAQTSVIRTWPNNSSFSQFCHSSATTTDYGFLQQSSLDLYATGPSLNFSASTQDVSINAVTTTKSIILKIGGVAKVTIADTSITASVKVIGPACTTATATFNAPHGTAPSTPANGDMWTTTAGIFFRVNGTTKTVTTT